MPCRPRLDDDRVGFGSGSSAWVKAQSCRSRSSSARRDDAPSPMGRAEKGEPCHVSPLAKRFRRPSIVRSLESEPKSRTHLARCPECRRFQLRVSTSHAAGRPSVIGPAPHPLKESLGAELARTVRPSPHGSRCRGASVKAFRWRRSARWIGALAPAVVAAVVLPLGALSATLTPDACAHPVHPPSPISPKFTGCATFHPFLANAGGSS